jgi:hypothetical protein
MNEDTLKKFITNIHEMLDLHEKQRELYFQLIEAVTVKCYKDSHPEATHVYLASWYGRTGTEGNYERDKHRTYVALDKYDPLMQRLLKLNERSWTMDKAYKDLVVKGYDLTKFFPDKTIATATRAMG